MADEGLNLSPNLNQLGYSERSLSDETADANLSVNIEEREIQLTVRPVCLICRFLLEVKKNNSSFASCISCSSPICQDCASYMEPIDNLLCSENCRKVSMAL